MAQNYDSGLTAANIKEIFDTAIPDDALGVWLTAAEAKVAELPEHDALTDETRKEITRFLTAALATAQDPRVDEESHEAATVSYQGERMQYREVAALLDPTGTLAGGSGSEDQAFIETLEVR